MQVNPTPSTNIPAYMGIAFFRAANSSQNISWYLTAWQPPQNVRFWYVLCRSIQNQFLLFSNTVRAGEITWIWIYHIKEFCCWSCLPIISFWYFNLQNLFFIQELLCAIVHLLNDVLLFWIVGYWVQCTFYRRARRRKTRIEQTHPNQDHDTGIFLNKS